MVAEHRGHDALVTVVQRKSSEEELWDVSKTARRKSSVEERLAGGPVDGPKRYRVHPETYCGHCTDGVQCRGGRCGDDCGNSGPPLNEPETAVSITVDGLSENVRGAT